MPCKNITRYTYETTAFQGYRLAICKNKRLFTRYFSDSQYGGADAALQPAMRVRANIFTLFEQGHLTVSQIFATYPVSGHLRQKAKVRSGGICGSCFFSFPGALNHTGNVASGTGGAYSYHIKKPFSVRRAEIPQHARRRKRQSVPKRPLSAIRARESQERPGKAIPALMRLCRISRSKACGTLPRHSSAVCRPRRFPRRGRGSAC